MKKIKTKTYSCEGFGPTKVEHFNEKGQLTMIEDGFDDRGTVGITYSDDGKIECTTNFYNERKWHREFNDNGDVIAIWEEDESSKILFELDEHGRVLKAITPYGDEYTNSYEDSYDEQGRIIHTIDSIGNETWYKYDDNGNLIHYKSNTDDYVKRYDENGRVIRIEHANGLIDEISYEYYEE